MNSKLLILLAICLNCVSAYAQKFNELKEQAEEAYNAYDLHRAVVLAEEALELANTNKENHLFDYATIKHDLGVYYALSNNIEKGIEFIQEGNSIIKELKSEESKEYIEKLNNTVAVLYMLNMQEKALETSQKSVQLSKLFYGENDKEYGYALNSNGMILLVLGRYTEAEESYLQALGIFEKDTKSDEYPSVLSNLGDLYISLGEYDSAEKYLLQGKKNFEKHNKTDIKPYSDCLFTLGKVYKLMGEYERSINSFNASGKVIKALMGENHQEYGTNLSSIAGVYEEMGDYTKAEELFMQAIKIKEATIGIHDLSYFISSNNLAKLYISLDRINEARAILEPVVINAAPNVVNYPIDYVSFGSNLALVYQKLGMYNDAEVMYSNLLLLQESILGKDHFDNVTIVNNLATLKIEQEKFEEADTEFDSCLEILEKNNMTATKDYVDIQYMKGLNLMNMQRYLMAKDYLVKAVKQANKIYGANHKMYATININLGYLYYKLENVKEATKFFTEGMDSYKRMIEERLSFMSNEEKEQLKTDIQLHFSFFKQFVLANRNPELIAALYDYNLMLKSMIISSKVKVRKEVLASNYPELKDLFNQWTSYREMLNRLYSFSSQDLLAANFNIDSLSNYTKLLENKIALQTASLNEISAYNNISWKDIQAKLDQNEAAVEIIRTAYYGEKDPIPVKYLALIVSSETVSAPEMVVLDDGFDMENDWSSEFYYQLFNKKDDNLSYNRFWSAINNQLKGKEKIYVSRTGIYHVLNISTLKKPDTDKFVLDENEIVLVSNTRDVLSMKAKGDAPISFNPKKEAVLFGYPNYYLDIVEEESHKNELLSMANNDERAFKKDFELIADLPGTKTEVDNIAQILATTSLPTSIYLEDEATESKLKNLDQPSILHIATHGFFDWQYEDEQDVSRTDRSVSVKDPLYRSGLMMAGSGFVVKLVEGKMSLIDNLEDGVLSAYEVVNMDLRNTDMVVLSACLSGIGETKVKDTESFSGLPQAFIIAGAKAVVTSGWSVDDTATQELMTLFYSNLAKNMPKRKALREAQIALKQKFPQPFYWGPFMMIGQ